MSLIKLEADEFASLIRLAAEERQVLAGALGGYVDTEKSPWVVQHLAQWRGVAFQDGAGI